ncbi:TIR domain-containing protein [Clavibacter sp. km1a]|uniref:TIR domain-containing protein n=1 Tax=Clavibacter sp. km1a TaxID=3459136 RepID=UPI004041EA97
MANPRAFISFEMEDRYARDFLVQQARDSNNDIEFVDYSVQNPWDTSWKTNCSLRIARTKGTIVLIGATTHKSEAVLWEIAETKRQGHHLFGIQTQTNSTFTIPGGLPAASVIRWKFVDIVARLQAWK